MTIKIAWITSGFSADETDYCGAAAFNDLAREISRNPDVELIIFSFYYPLNKPEYDFYGAKVYSFAEHEHHSRFDKLKIWRKCMKKFAEINSQKKFDLIHAMWANEPGYVASRVSRKHGIPLIVNVCGGELGAIREIKYGSRLKFWQKKFVDKSFRQAKRIVCGSDYIADKIRTHYNESIADKTVRIPFGVDENLFTCKSKRRFDTPALINVASFVPVKDHQTLL